MTGYKRGPDGEVDPAAVLAYGAAALFMCWPEKVTWAAKPRPKAWYPGVDVLRYGGVVYENLRQATKGEVSVYDLNGACHEAEAWAYRSGMTQAELDEAKRFLADEEEPTGTPSSSAGSTGSPPDGGTA
jgi:hypothetical protein